MTAMCRPRRPRWAPHPAPWVALAILPLLSLVLAGTAFPTRPLAPPAVDVRGAFDGPFNHSSGGSANSIANGSGNSSSGGPTSGGSPSSSTNPFALEILATPTYGFAPLKTYLQATACGGNWSGGFYTSGCLGPVPNGSGPFTLTVCPVSGSCTVTRNWSGLGAYSFYYTYTAGGTYNLTGTLSNASGAFSTYWLLVQVVAPIFELVVSPGGAPSTYNLTGEVLGGASPYRMTICPEPGKCVTNASVNWTGIWTLSWVYNRTGNYSASALMTDADGALAGATAAVDVTASPPLMVHTHQASPPGGGPLTVAFQTQISGGSPPYSLEWFFGDGTSGSGVNGGLSTHTYASAGSFTPRLTVRDGVGHVWSETLPPVSVGASASGGTPGGGLLPAVGTGGWASPVLLVLGLVALAGTALVAERRWSRARTEAGYRLVYHLTQDDIDPELIARAR
ncbi:MAG: PKD domain-containing protein [Thermoplasmata archaeon]|nr:PKD domain-containing protein [Thermoplasmata archaeon]